MTAVQFTPLESGFCLRAPMRGGQVYAIFDATGFPTLADELDASSLDYCSLFLGDDAVMLRDEAPWLVQLPADKIDVWGEILRRANTPFAGMMGISGATLDELRRHWKKWLSVYIPTQEALVLFRFYDARIALAFLGTVGAADAQAFFGPNDMLFVQRGGALIEMRVTLPVPATRLGAGRWYQITDAQMKAFSDVTADAFRDRYRRYMREIWPEETVKMDQAALDAMAQRAIAMAKRLDIVPQPNVIVDFSVIEMVAPEVIDDAEFYIGQVKDRVKPSGYSNILLSVAASSLTEERAMMVYARAAYWTSFP